MVTYAGLDVHARATGASTGQIAITTEAGTVRTAGSFIVAG
jgi:hypothetical protein